MKKIIFSAVIAALLALFAGCSSPPPELDTVKDEFKSLIEASSEINNILFGEGLPTYDREDGSSESKAVYENLVAALDGYEAVRLDCKFQNANDIKAAADKVYSPEYLAPVYKMIFDGFADEELGVTSGKFLEWDGRFYQNMQYEAYVEGVRSYDFDSMKIVKPSTGEFVNVEIDSELDGEKMKITLSFTKTDNGWRLDSPTY